MPTIFKGTIPVEDWTNVGNAINQSLNRFSDLNRQEEERQRKERKESEAKFLSDMKQDPVFSMSSYWQQDQARKMNELQSYIGKVYRESKQYYHPDLNGQIDIQRHLSAFRLYQQKIKSDMEAYQQAADAIEKDPYGQKYDKEHFLKRVNEWTDPKGDGTLSNDLLLPPKIGDFGAYLRSKHFTGTKKESQTQTLKNGKVIVNDVETPMTDDEKRGAMKNEILSNPSAFRTITEEYANLSPQEKEKYKIEYHPEKQSGDEIIDYAWDKYGSQFANPVQKNTERIHFGRSGEKKIDKIFELETPTDQITVQDAAGQTSVIDTWGGYTIPATTVASVPARKYFDMDTGEYADMEPGENELIKYPNITYLPVVGNKTNQKLAVNLVDKSKSDWRKNPQYNIKYYLDNNNKLKKGYRLQGVLVTNSGKAFELTPQLKAMLKTKFPDFSQDIEETPYTINPKTKLKNIKTNTKSDKTYDVGGNKLTRQQLNDLGYDDDQINEAITSGKIK